VLSLLRGLRPTTASVVANEGRDAVFERIILRSRCNRGTALGRGAEATVWSIVIMAVGLPRKAAFLWQAAGLGASVGVAQGFDETFQVRVQSVNTGGPRWLTDRWGGVTDRRRGAQNTGN